MRDPAERRFLSKSGLRLHHWISGKTETVNLRIEREIITRSENGNREELFREREITERSSNLRKNNQEVEMHSEERSLTGAECLKGESFACCGFFSLFFINIVIETDMFIDI